MRVHCDIVLTLLAGGLLAIAAAGPAVADAVTQMVLGRGGGIAAFDPRRF